MKRANVVSVRSLFSGSTRMRCASSSRGFHWQPAQVAQLLVDLETSARDSIDEEDVPEERLYLGVITTGRAKAGLATLHDGRQRLVVLTMFIAFARDRVLANSERNKLDRMLVRRAFARPPEPRLRLPPEEHAWFAHFILAPGATKRLPATPPPGSPRELLLAARFMEHAFASYSVADLRNIIDFLTHHTAVVRSLAEERPVFASALPALPAPSSSRMWDDLDPSPSSSRYRVAAE